MGINERGINGSDPGAIPGGSTNISPVIAEIMGPISFDGPAKGVSFPQSGPL